MEYRREIDGLRALAVLPVILFHAGFEAFSGGFVGVDVFFVISGYLITGIIILEKESGTFSLAGFYERRARRILPALFLVMAACMPFAWWWFLPGDRKDFSRNLVAVSIFASNILSWRESGYFETAAELKPLLHTWSLAVEEQYYLLFPVFLMVLWKLGRTRLTTVLVVVAIASLALAEWASLDSPGAAFFLLPARGWELLVGSFIAVHFAAAKGESASFLLQSDAVNEAMALAGLLLVGYSIFAFDESTPFPSRYALVPTVGAALVIIFARPRTLVGRLLGTPAVAGVGLISYSAYLWHQPLFAFARDRSETEPDTAVLAALIALTLVLAYLSARFVERPFRRRNRFSPRQVFVLGSVVSLGFAGLGLLGQLDGAAMGRFDSAYYPAVQGIVDASRDGHRVCDAELKAHPGIESGCRIGARGAPAAFAVIGDSHARALVPALDEAANDLSIGARTYAYRSCLPVMHSNSVRQDAVHRACKALKKDFYEKLKTDLIPKVVVIHARWTTAMEKGGFDNAEGGVEDVERSVWVNEWSDELGYEAALARDYAESIIAILESGRKVVLVYPVPEMGWDVPRALQKAFARHGQVRDDVASTRHDVFVKRNRRANAAFDAIGEHPDLVRIRPESVLCDTLVKGRCAAHLNGLPLYMDDDHLSVVGARMVVGAMRSVLGG